MKNIAYVRKNLHVGVLFLLFIAVLLISVFFLWAQPQSAYANDIHNNAVEASDPEVEEQGYHATGCIPVPQQQWLSVPELCVPEISRYSTGIVDYSDAFPVPGDQGSQGSCTA